MAPPAGPLPQPMAPRPLPAGRSWYQEPAVLGTIGVLVLIVVLIVVLIALASS